MDDSTQNTQKISSDQVVSQAIPVTPSVNTGSVSDQHNVKNQVPVAPQPVSESTVSNPVQAVSSDSQVSVQQGITPAASKVSRAMQDPVAPPPPVATPPTAPIAETKKDVVEAPPAPTQQPVSGGPAGKEREPVYAPLPDVAKLSDKEIVEEEKVVEAELESMVEKSPAEKKPDIPQEVKDAGVTATDDDAVMSNLVAGAVVPPMSLDEAKFTRKRHKWRESISWLSELIIYHWKKMRSKPEDKGGSAFG